MTRTPTIDRKTTRFLIFIILVALFLYVSRYLPFSQEALRTRLEQVPPALAGIVFIALYVGVTFFIWLGPKDVFRITAAYIAGPWVSTVWVYIAEMINLVIFFNLSRKMGRGFVQDQLKGNWEKVDQAVTRTSDWWIFMIRMFTIIPLRFADIGFGLTGVKLRRYFVISAVATPIRIFVVQFFLSLGMDTITDPQKFAAYLNAHPGIMFGGFAYFATALVLMFVLKNKLRNT